MKRLGKGGRIDARMIPHAPSYQAIITLYEQVDTLHPDPANDGKDEVWGSIPHGGSTHLLTSDNAGQFSFLTRWTGHTPVRMRQSARLSTVPEDRASGTSSPDGPWQQPM